MTRRRRNRLQRWSRRLTGGKFAFGRTRRPRRSRRLKSYEAVVGLQPASAWSLEPAYLGSWLRQQAGILAAILLAAAALYLLFGTSLFYIYDIELIGAKRMPKAEVYNRTQLEALHFFWLDPSDVEERIEEEPLVIDARLSAVPPNRVKVEIQEREPVAVWQSGEQSLFVDAEGTLFGIRGDATQMLTIRDLRGAPVQPGDKVDPIVVRSAVDLAAQLPERTAFDWEPGTGISFVSNGGWRVALGDHTRLPAKIAALQAFESQIQPEKEIVLLDLSVPEHPYYKVGP